MGLGSSNRRQQGGGGLSFLRALPFLPTLRSSTPTHAHLYTAGLVLTPISPSRACVAESMTVFVCARPPGSCFHVAALVFHSALFVSVIERYKNLTGARPGPCRVRTPSPTRALNPSSRVHMHALTRVRAQHTHARLHTHTLACTHAVHTRAPVHARAQPL